MNDDASAWAIPVFPEEEIPSILHAVLRSLKGLRKTKPRELETGLNKRLRKSLCRDSQLRDSPVEVDREKVLDDDDTDDEGRLDISFTFSTERRKPWPYFAIEAKRLHVTYKGRMHPQIPQYVTDRQGMMCFADGRYSKGLASAAMLGYVFNGDVAKARAAIASSIQLNHSKLKTLPPHGLAPCRYAIGGVDESCHDFDGRGFTLYHILSAV
jgi:hypothetical protein